ncbi:cell division protein CrgA [Kribbia dieselivorans]|uniref:cell division protein CrgA n=1 Tax=Kribbia dieselivorans TaxID=331526 RepID=UPI001FDF8F34|nr:cell division protein CrgA [Kribbia dieselivorans]
MAEETPDLDGAGATTEREAKREAKRAAKKARQSQKITTTGSNSAWFVPLMLTLMLAGLLWVVVFYISNQQYPVPQWGNWNLGVGFGLMLAGFLMTTRWK